MKLRSGDTVVVITGKDRGKTGRIVRVLPDADRVVVEGVNMQKRHTKPRGNIQGGIIAREGSVHASNVMLVCPQTGKRTRIGIRFSAQKTKERFSKKSKEGIVAAEHKSKGAADSKK